MRGGLSFDQASDLLSAPSVLLGAAEVGATTLRGLNRSLEYVADRTSEQAWIDLFRRLRKSSRPVAGASSREVTLPSSASEARASLGPGTAIPSGEDERTRPARASGRSNAPLLVAPVAFVGGRSHGVGRPRPRLRNSHAVPAEIVRLPLVSAVFDSEVEARWARGGR